MDYIHFARMFGLFYFCVSLSILFNMDNAKKIAQELTESAVGRILAGILPLFFGSWVIVTNNIWTGWATIVTVIGWILFLVGIFRLWFVNSWVKSIQRNVDKAPVMFALFGMIMGLLLLYVGFIAR